MTPSAPAAQKGPSPRRVLATLGARWTCHRVRRGSPRQEGELAPASPQPFGAHRAPQRHAALPAASVSPLGHPNPPPGRWRKPSPPCVWLHFDTGPIPAPSGRGWEPVGCWAVGPPSLTPKAAVSPRPPPAPTCSQGHGDLPGARGRWPPCRHHVPLLAPSPQTRHKR